MAGRRRRGRGHRIPWGLDDDPWPDAEGDLADDFPDEPPDHSPGSGGAGVREPRRPNPTLPGMGAANPEPEDDTVLDVASDSMS